MSRAKPIRVGCVLVVAVATIVTGEATASADPGVSPFVPGVPVPNPIVSPWEGGGSSPLLTPGSDLTPDLDAADGEAPDVRQGGVGFVCNDQRVFCPWGTW